jgi:hypothetical protein
VSFSISPPCIGRALWKSLKLLTSITGTLPCSTVLPPPLLTQRLDASPLVDTLATPTHKPNGKDRKKEDRLPRPACPRHSAPLSSLFRGGERYNLRREHARPPLPARGVVGDPSRAECIILRVGALGRASA